MTKKEKLIIKILKRVRDNNPDTFNYVIPNLFTKKLKSYMLIREDLKFITNLTCKLIEFKNQDNVDETLCSGLWYSIIIIYGKFFTENHGGMSKLEKTLLVNAKLKSKDMDIILTDLCHSFIAHRDDTEKEQAVVFMKVPKGKDLNNETEYLISSAKISSPDTSELKSYVELFAYLTEKVEGKIQKHSQKVHNAFFNTLTAKQINLLLNRFLYHFKKVVMCYI